MDVTLFLNHQCNLACTYCYNGEKFSKVMSEEMMRKGVEMAFDGGPRVRISFFGGEPLLEFDLMKKAITYARKLEKQKQIASPVRFSMTTNGTLVDEATLETLKEERFHLVFSIDGSRKSHELTRPYTNGESSYYLIVENFKRAMKAIPSVETITVVDPVNVGFMAQSFEALCKIGVQNFNFSLNYEANWTDEQLASLEKSLKEMGDLYIERYREGIDFALDLFDSKIITHLKGGYACRDRCKFGKEELCIAPSGFLYPCERLVGEDKNREIAIGHIDTGIDLNKVTAMGLAKNNPDTDCANCNLKQRCMFWCGCVNYATTGAVGKTSGILCHLEQMLIAQADQCAEILFAEKNPVFIGKFYCAS